ncbi:prolyl oligopeptidase family serine peptidase [Pontiella sulfatireligans]|uniref:Peptidase S9 prolyl oligopeptidase catalytic domain-containing protein n=1 Tax=Pontiella sulfatireligans TaxID=2750658 RepID=A0A6C2UDW9_9BACT|nr:prolyl oligopeptidase family serine peptidase [Pontiella sulfatireligans]VGO18089.1 hypothetical protein SCARR_00140 [Pontiella sulfatireligans]
MKTCSVFLVICAVAGVAIAARSENPSNSQRGDPFVFWDPIFDQQHEQTGTYRVSCPGLPSALWNTIAVPLGEQPVDALKNPLTYRYGSDKAAVKKAKTKKEKEELSKFRRFEGEPVVFTVCAPTDIEPGEPLGLIFYLSPKQGALDKDSGHRFTYVVDDRRMVTMTANLSGNYDSVAWRVACALAGVELAKRRYNIRPDRVYATGSSGGGRVTSYIMLRYPEIFTGAMPNCGFYSFATWEPSNIPPESLERFYTSSRLAVIEGKDDFNRAESKENYDFYKAKMSMATYIEDPNAGHGVRDPVYLDKAIDFLDSPLSAEGEAAWAKIKPGIGDAKRRGEILAALRPYRGVMFNQPWGAEALPALNDLSTAYRGELKQAEEAVGAQSPKVAKKAIDEFEMVWGVAAKGDVVRLREKVANGIAGKIQGKNYEK